MKTSAMPLDLVMGCVAGLMAPKHITEHHDSDAILNPIGAQIPSCSRERGCPVQSGAGTGHRGRDRRAQCRFNLVVGEALPPRGMRATGKRLKAAVISSARWHSVAVVA